MQTCSICNKSKNESMFGMLKQQNIKRAQCKQCAAIYAKQYYQQNLDDKKLYAQQRRKQLKQYIMGYNSVPWSRLEKTLRQFCQGWGRGFESLPLRQIAVCPARTHR